LASLKNKKIMVAALTSRHEDRDAEIVVARLKKALQHIKPRT